MPDTVLTVSEVARSIAAALDQAFGDEIWVDGELHGLSRSRNGHVFFDLVETGPLGGPALAVLPVALFDRHRRGVNAMLTRTGGVRMTDGMAIRIRATVDFYRPQGRVQLVMTGIDPSYTLGRLASDRDRVLRALAADGLLDRNGSRPVPLVPLRVGLVTAGGSAAFADFVHELEQSGLAFTVRHADTPVQGHAAEAAICAALRTLAIGAVDVIAIVRGGGARTDLAAFDSDAIARTIASLSVPVLTGIGHETDRSVADEVAHTAHKTPTACASALVSRVDEFMMTLDSRGDAVRAAVLAAVAREHDRLGHRISASAAVARRVTQNQDRHLADRAREVADRGRRILGSEATRVDHIEERVRTLDPRRLLARGWTITRTATGEVARPEALGPGVELVTTFATGEVRSAVQSVTAHRDRRPDSDTGPPDSSEEN